MPHYWTDPVTGKKYEQGDPALVGCGNPPTVPGNVGEGRIPMVPSNDATGAVKKDRKPDDAKDPFHATRGGFQSQRGPVPPNVRKR